MRYLPRRTSIVAVSLATMLAGAVTAVAAPAAPPGPAQPAVAAVSAFGVQRLLVVLVEHEHDGCPTDSHLAQCPRYTAAQWQMILQRDLNAWYATETYGKTSFQVHVLVDPDTANGWWPAPHTQAEYAANNAQNHDPFGPVGSVGRDTGEVIVAQALDRGALSTSELAATHRLLMMDNFHARGGTTNGRNVPLTYKPNGRTFSTTFSLIPEGPDDSVALSLAEHELGHQLGEPDLYERPCTLRPPGDNLRDHRAIDDNDCMGPWDHMALDYWGYPGFGAYTKQRIRWLNPSARFPAVKEVSSSFSGTVSLDPIERPAGGTLVIRVPNDPFAAKLGALFGNPGPYKGFMVECRRRLGNDQGLPAEGALVTYVDPARSGYAPITVARRQGGLVYGTVSNSILSTPGDSYTNSVAHVTFTYAGTSPSGGCEVDVNRTRYVYPHYSPSASEFAPVEAAGPVFGTDASFSGFVGTGVSVYGGSPSPRVAQGALGSRDRTKVLPTRKGHRATISFSYGNSGGKVAKNGTAIVRVNDPYTISVCGSSPKGRVVARVRLKTLKPGHLATKQVSFVPHTNGPIGVRVQIARSGEKAAQTAGREAGSLAFTTATSGADEVKASRTTFRISSASTCPGPVVPRLSPLVLPEGWKIQVLGVAKPLAPGTTRKVTVVASPPTGASPQALEVPIAITAGEVHIPADPAVPYGDTVGELEFLGGLDLMLRVVAPGQPLPSYVQFGRPRLPTPTSYPATPSPPADSTLTLTCPPSTDLTVTVNGVLAPAKAGAAVTLTYTHFGDGVTVTHPTTTGVNGGFSDQFSDSRNSWTVQASWLGDGTEAASVSNTCSFGVIIGRPAH